MENEKALLPAKLQEMVEVSGLQLTRAEEISSHFAPYLVEIQSQSEILKGLKLGNPDHVKPANSVKNALGKICSRLTDQKKEDKESAQEVIKYIDKVFNYVEGTARLTQSEARTIEDHPAKIERERIEKLSIERENKLVEFEVEVIPPELGAMDNDVWESYLMGVKTQYEAVKDAEAKAEKERIEAQRIEDLASQRREHLITKDLYRFAEIDMATTLGAINDDDFTVICDQLEQVKQEEIAEQERVKAENDRLKKEAKRREIELKLQEERKEAAEEKNNARLNALTGLGLMYNGQEFIYQDINFHWTDIVCMADDEFTKSLEGAAVRMAAIKEEEKELEAAIKEESDRHERIAAELNAKQDAEIAAKQAEEAQLQADLNKGDAAKMSDLLDELHSLKIKYEFKSAANKKRYNDTGLMIDKIIVHIKK